ncbi:hypothetical protein COCC4DRAFT_139792 [Bipolaris maydis ATCC 48331]|uniref:Uncharacterized protein n=2 Tax=Cochliobolus heterostrophus TaxID=5016 RepID=M2U3C6_COCH5|nr:uncharacterized protein COCC4DRAFT_139792 [Bipolaris maydis ATCC 48331]EMD93064.1 hypothetical protein COCHEDRAFT_1029291 [Bipolaris maydis C5]ENI04547.1 hypothetical protein COCC4DRAFT_139792 [Bipolaris maydis ATCC 48331]
MSVDCSLSRPARAHGKALYRALDKEHGVRNRQRRSLQWLRDCRLAGRGGGGKQLSGASLLTGILSAYRAVWSKRGTCNPTTQNCAHSDMLPRPFLTTHACLDTLPFELDQGPSR